MIYPLVLEFAADGIPVAVTCRVLGFSKQAFYQWRVNPVSDRDWADAHLINAAYDIHNDDPTFGYRFIADELPAKGIRAGENRVARLCSQQRIWSLHARKRGLNRKPGATVHDDLINRRFVANRPNEKWLTDITEHPTDEGKLYLCAIRDVCSGKVVGYSMHSRMKAALAVSPQPPTSPQVRRDPTTPAVRYRATSRPSLSRPRSIYTPGSGCTG